MDKSVYITLKKVWDCLPTRRHQQFGLLIFLTLLSSIAEIVSLGAVVPFIAAITDPDKVFAYPLVSYLAEFLEITSGAELVVPLTIAFAVAAVVSGMFRLLVLWATIQLGNRCGADISVDIYSRTLFQPYAVHIARSSSEIVSGITQKVGTVTSVLISVVMFFTSLSLFFAIIGTLIAFNPMVALWATGSFGFLYFLIGYTTRSRLSTNSLTIAQQQNKVVKSIQEGLGSIRDVLLDSTQNVYISTYSKSVDKLRLGNSENAFISQFPRYAMESLGLVLIGIFVLVLNNSGSGITGALPLLGILALGAQRLLPIIQQIYGNWSVLIGSHNALIDVLELLEQPLPSQDNTSLVEGLTLKESICFKDVSFKYSENLPWVFEGLNLAIPKGSRVGIIGTTGGGKSTLVDILMGLLQANKGDVLIDRQNIKSDVLRASWQRTIAHVPQSIYLADSTITQNIAFGVPSEQIDIDRVKLAAKQAKLANFIENGPEGYNAIVGERGVRLSGGQRQRIGIARALYKNANVLIFDEATSALDDRTELDIMQTIDSLSRDFTMIIIAHRITTLKNCDIIFNLKDGIAKQHTYHQIINANEGLL
ncbi:ABC transporter ATP-binding protein [Gammaproteobacteria bacterium]|nr:ABC transporter ATP-binding protein [Gammaproteobacteria bacterium]MDC3306818.1 ABC transporter ATP-binding protein/permease [Gammaproteobacteria bacterium]